MCGDQTEQAAHTNVLIYYLMYLFYTMVHWSESVIVGDMFSISPEAISTPGPFAYEVGAVTVRPPLMNEK